MTTDGSVKDGLSGHYEYHSTKKYPDNPDPLPVFARRADIPGLTGKQFFLIHRNGFWFITNETSAINEKLNFGALGSFLRLQTKGME